MKKRASPKMAAVSLSGQASAAFFSTVEVLPLTRDGLAISESSKGSGESAQPISSGNTHPDVPIHFSWSQFSLVSAFILAEQTCLG